jgi:hypothetical protein
VISTYTDSSTIGLGACNGFSLIAGSTATCAGASNCEIKQGKMGVAPGTAFTGNFVADILGNIVSTGATGASAACATDGLTAWRNGRKLAATRPAMLAEMGGVTFYAGVHTHGSAINIALTSPKVYLDAEDDPNAVFVFNVGTTLTTCAGSEIVLRGGAKESNVYWVLGTALTMGADSTLIGNVLAGTAITIGTNGKIFGRAIAQTAVTCETGCTVKTGPNPACNTIDANTGVATFNTGSDKYEVGTCINLSSNGVDFTDSDYNEWSCTSSTAACMTTECVQSLVSDGQTAAAIVTLCNVRKTLIPRQPLL